MYYFLIHDFSELENLANNARTSSLLNILLVQYNLYADIFQLPKTQNTIPNFTQHQIT